MFLHFARQQTDGCMDDEMMDDESQSTNVHEAYTNQGYDAWSDEHTYQIPPSNYVVNISMDAEKNMAFIEKPDLEKSDSFTVNNGQPHVVSISMDAKNNIAHIQTPGASQENVYVDEPSTNMQTHNDNLKDNRSVVSHKPKIGLEHMPAWMRAQAMDTDNHYEDIHQPKMDNSGVHTNVKAPSINNLSPMQRAYLQSYDDTYDFDMKF